MNDIETLERHIMTTEHKVVSKDAAQTVIMALKFRLNRLEDELHQLKKQTAYEPYTSPQSDTAKSDWKMLQQRSVM